MTNTLPQFEQDFAAMPAAGFGAMETAQGSLPLKRLGVRSRVDGLACRTVITQVFRNLHDDFVEATYIFPLPGRFAVTACKMRVKDRVIEAELKERSQARADYDRAIREGHRASIAEEERSETFNLRVGNIPPDEEVAVELTMIGVVSVVEGEATLRIPLVVAPRYIPGQPLDGPSVGAGTAVDTDEVPDASRITPPTLLPGMPNPVELSVEVVLDPGELTTDIAWKEQIRASLHSVLVSQESPFKIRLQSGERINRDFILRWPVLQNNIQTTADYSHADAHQAGTFVVTVMPPRATEIAARPRDVVFVLDRSGSMDGWKIVAARRAVARMIDSLHDEDRFRVLAFDNLVDSPCSEWQDATDQHRWQAAEWIANVDARGGTELGGALRAAIQPFAAFGMPESRDAVVVVVTDGHVGGEDSVMRTIESLGLPRLPRIFTMGIDRAVNASILAKLADSSGGTFELVESEKRLDRVMERFHRDIGSPVLTDIKIEPLNFDLIQGSQTPCGACSVFADRPLMLFGRIAGPRKTLRLRVTATRADGKPWEAELSAQQSDVPTLVPLWGRGRVRDLEDQYARAGRKAGALQSEIVAVSLESHVLSRFTSYVAVDHAEKVNVGGVQHTIVQPVEEPEGWAMDIHRRKYKRVGAKRSLGARSARDEKLSQSVSVLPMKQFGGFGLPTAGSGVVGEADRFSTGKSSDDSCDSLLHEFTDTAINFTKTVDDDADVIDVVANRFLEILLAEANSLRASHVYIETGASEPKVHYVIDGDAQERDRPSRGVLSAVVRHLCDLAKIEPEKSALKKGELTITVDKNSLTLRVYIIPTATGPALVIRLTSQPNKVSEPNTPQSVQSWLRNARVACDGRVAKDEVYQSLVADSIS